MLSSSRLFTATEILSIVYPPSLVSKSLSVVNRLFNAEIALLLALLSFPNIAFRSSYSVVGTVTLTPERSTLVVNVSLHSCSAIYPSAFETTLRPSLSKPFSSVPIESIAS